MKGRRLFIGLKVPVDTRQAIESAVLKIRNDKQLSHQLNQKGIHWIPRENWHLTLLFCGKLPEDLLSKIVAVLAGVARRNLPVRVQLEGLEGFPETRVQHRGHDMLVAVVTADERLKALQNEVSEVIGSQLGLRLNDRPWRPHISLAGFRRPWEMQPVPLCHQYEVAAVTLFESHLDRKGARYVPLSDHPLGRSGGGIGTFGG
jgi:2'-5' RNA ligase